MIKSVIKFQNDMVMVFDAEGEQITEYQGQYEEMKAIILRDAPPETIFARWFNDDTAPKVIFREEW